MTLYIDGQDVGGNYSGAGGAMATTADSGTVAKYTPWSEKLGDGSIDDLRVYDRALSPQDVQALANE
jgi:hypothetical protein